MKVNYPSDNEIKTWLLTNWVSFDEYDTALVQYYTFITVWIQQVVDLSKLSGVI